MREQHCPPNFYFDGTEEKHATVEGTKEVLAKDDYVPPQWQRGGLSPPNPRDRQLHPKRFHPRNQLGLPHPSFDLDGDGMVDQKDYFFSNMFDKDRDGKLNDKERKEALEALNNGIADNYMFLPDVGVKKCTEEDIGNRNQGWADMTHLIKTHEGGKTYSRLHNGRRQRAVEENENVRQHYEMHNPAQPIEFRRPIAEKSKGTTSVLDTLEAERQRKRAVRVANSMFPEKGSCNPEREGWNMIEYKTLAKPRHRTTGDVIKSRSVRDLKLLEECQAKNVGSFVPAAERMRQKWFQMLDKRYNKKPDKTFTKLKKKRHMAQRATAEGFMEKRVIGDIPKHFGAKEALYTDDVCVPDPRFEEARRVSQKSFGRLTFNRTTHKDLDEYLDPMDYPDDPYNELKERVLVEKDPSRRPVTEKLVNEPPPDLPVRDRETFAEFAQRKKVSQDDLIIQCKSKDDDKGFFERLLERAQQPSLADEMPLFSSFTADHIFREPQLPDRFRTKQPRPVNVFSKSLTARPKTPPPRFPKARMPLSMTDTILARGSGVRSGDIRTTAFQHLRV